MSTKREHGADNEAIAGNAGGVADPPSPGVPDTKRAKLMDDTPLGATLLYDHPANAGASTQSPPSAEDQKKTENSAKTANLPEISIGPLQGIPKSTYNYRDALMSIPKSNLGDYIGPIVLRNLIIENTGQLQVAKTKKVDIDHLKFNENCVLVWDGQKVDALPSREPRAAGEIANPPGQRVRIDENIQVVDEFTTELLEDLRKYDVKAFPFVYLEDILSATTTPTLETIRPALRLVREHVIKPINRINTFLAKNYGPAVYNAALVAQIPEIVLGLLGYEIPKLTGPEDYALWVHNNWPLIQPIFGANLGEEMASQLGLFHTSNTLELAHSVTHDFLETFTNDEVYKNQKVLLSKVVACFHMDV